MDSRRGLTGGGGAVGGGTEFGEIGNRARVLSNGEINTGCPENNSNHMGRRNANNTRGRRKRQNKLLKCMNINAQSLKYKMDEFKNIIERERPHIISVTETWGKEWMGDAIFSVNDYNFYRDDRDEKGGGGTLLYISKKLGQRACRPLNEVTKEKHFSSNVWCWVTPMNNNKKILVGSIYRSPNSSRENNRLLLEQLERANDIAGENRVLIMGDFNVPGIDWINRDVLVGASKIDKDVYKKMQDCFLYQHVTKPTRFRGTSSSTLDLIFTKEEEDVKNIQVLEPLGKSDHGIVIGNFVCEWKNKVKQRITRMYYKGQYETINQKIEEIDWEGKFYNKTVNECWEIFKTIIQDLVDKYVPMSTPRDYNEPWMNRRLLKLWKKKQNAWNRYTSVKSQRKWRLYRKDANKLKKNTRKARRAYERKIAKESATNKRAFFRYVNSKLTVRPEITAMKNKQGILVEDDKEMTNVIGGYFKEVFSEETTGEMPAMNNQCVNQIGEVRICRSELQKILEKLNVNKSCGPDNLHPHLLQKTARTISEPLRIIFDKSLNDGECPNDWRTANVTPIHKKGDRTDPSNYRPVSLTSQVCKVLETLVREKIVKHMRDNKLFSSSQHGFREGRSCLTNLLETLEQWTKIIDEEDCIDVAYLDFRKAFDLVSHRHLLYKMTKYGISGQVHGWVKAFLSDRSQRVVIRGTSSEACSVTSGVPQGSVLGPVLFLIFINDLPLEVLSPLSLFADDSKIFTRIVTSNKKTKWTGFDGHSALQRDLTKVQEWAKKWKMEFNVDKCKIMHIGNKNPKHVYGMGGTELESTKAEKDLGVTIDDQLDLGKHIRNIVAKANRVLGLIKISFACLDKSMFLNLYPVLVRPHLEYCVQVWSPSKKKYIKLLERVQRRATKLVPELRDLEYSERLMRLGLTTLEERRVRGDMIQTYKFVTRKEDIDPAVFFQMAVPRPGANSKKIYRQRPRLDVRKNFYSQRVAPRWNILDNNVIEVKKTGTFKKNYDKMCSRRRERVGNDQYVWNY